MRLDSAGHSTLAGDLPAAFVRSSRTVIDEHLAWETLALLHGLPVAVAEHWPHAGLLRAVAGMVAEDARHAGLSVVRALVALKTAWACLPEARGLPLPDQRDLLDRLVTGCIEAYYAPPSTAARSVLHLLPTDDPRERLDTVAATLLETVDGDVRRSQAFGAERVREAPSTGQPSSPALAHRLDRALASLPAEEVLGLIGALRRVRVSLWANHGPPGPSRPPADVLRSGPPGP